MLCIMMLYSSLSSSSQSLFLALLYFLVAALNSISFSFCIMLLFCTMKLSAYRSFLFYRFCLFLLFSIANIHIFSIKRKTSENYSILHSTRWYYSPDYIFYIYKNILRIEQYFRCEFSKIEKDKNDCIQKFSWQLLLFILHSESRKNYALKIPKTLLKKGK